MQDVAIVGIGCRFPGGADSPERFWSLLRDGKDAISEIPSDRFDLGSVFDGDPSRPGKMYARWGGFLKAGPEADGLDSFDAAFFGISPREAVRIDPQHRLLLESTWEALEDAGIPADRLGGKNIGVFVGISTHDYGDRQMYPAHRLVLDAHSNTGTATSIAANRISYLFDFRGPSLTVDTACSSSLTAIHLACHSLRTNECELAIVGGVQVLLVPELTIGFCKATMLSPEGHCKAFDASADGYVRSEGCGVVALKPLAAALADGDSIYAVIRSSAVNQDGHTNGLTVPSADAQERMIRTALAEAGLEPQHVQYVEAHGTGTPVGDPIEAAAIGRALGNGRMATEACMIGSVKTNIGHLEAASGIAGLIKTALMLHQRQIPPSLHFATPNPGIDFEGLKLRVPTELQSWHSPNGTPPTAGVSSFGFGGSNAHVILQAAPSVRDATVPTPDGAQILTLSARSQEALRSLARRYRDVLSDGVGIYDVCAAAALQRAHLEHRLAVVGSTVEDLTDGLDAFLTGENRANVLTGRLSAGGTPRIAFVFSGMGPQWWAMGRQLMARESVFRDVIEQCDRHLRPYAGFSLLEELGRDEATSRVGEADMAQMTNFAIQVALVALWDSWGIRPDAVIGHSAGEMAAAYTAGALDLGASVKLAFHRSRLQSRAAGRGRMLAVGQAPAELAEMLANLAGRVTLAAVNSPTSVTLSGDADALEKLQEDLQARQVFARLLPVEVPYHSQHMDAIRDELLDSLARLAPARAGVPMVSVVTGDHVAGEELGAEYWWRNVRQPVQFAAGIDRLIADGFTTFLEVGPHPVLGISVSECAAANNARVTLVGSLRRMEDERASMLRALGTLHVQGQAVNWERVFTSRPGRVGLPTYPWQRERHWLDLANTGEVQPVATGEHPLLGGRVRAARPIWESRLDDQRLEYLEQHLIQGTVVFPGAAYVEMALAAACADGPPGTPVGVRDINFERALFLSRRSDTLLQLSLEPERSRWEIHSRTGSAEASVWNRHVAGALDIDGTIAVPKSLDMVSIRAACMHPVEPTAFYESLERRGLHLGGLFQSIRELRVGEGQALAAIELAESADSNGYAIHPALLDGTFQSLVGAAFGMRADSGERGVFLPVRIERVTLHGAPPPGRLWAYARMRSAPGEAPAGDIVLLDEGGAVYVEVRGIQCQVLEPSAASARSEVIDDWLYEYRWEPKALESRLATDGSETALSAFSTAPGLDLSRMVDRLQAEADERSSAWDWREYYASIEERLNALAVAQIARCWRELEWQPRSGESVAVETVAATLGVRHERQALLRQMLEIWAERGSSVSEDVSTDELVEALLAEAPAYEAEIRLLDTCGRNLAGVLRGQVDSREVLFGPAALALAARMYRDSPPSRVYNTLTAETVAALANSAADGQPLRVLEVGGGTGGTTAYVLQRVPPDAVRYTFTDISPLFTERARLEFGTQSLEVRPLDIESDPTAQGFAAHAFDAVVAANVLHATADLMTTLRHVRRLLAPGGVLVLQEITRHPFWLDIIFGLTDGWWRFTDRQLRPAHPLLEEEQWRSVLLAAAFDDVGVMRDSLPTGHSAQAVFVARTGAAVDTSSDRWLVVGDDNGFASTVAARLGAVGQPARVVGGPEVAGAIDAIADTSTLRGIVYVATPEPLQQDTAGDVVLDRSLDACTTALEIMQAIAARPNLACELVMVTSVSQPLVGFDSDLRLDQAPLWGQARVAMREQARPRCRLVDLDASLDDGAAEALVAELLADSREREEEVAFRGSERFIRRLRRLALSDGPSVEARQRMPTEAFRAGIKTPGVLETLQFTHMERRPPGPGEVEIEIDAASLNFRDVMLAMGLLTTTATEGTFVGEELGIDCAGTVVARGAGVEGLAVGDPVMAIAAGALASHATTSALLVAPRPPSLDPETGSTILCAFVTAEYGLRHLARLQPGERVLIHAATGGVGLAALQVARDIGAEIFATAGNPEKRAYLRSLGIEHVMDSRSLQFADDILEQTDGHGVDVVLNSLSGAAIEKGLSILRPYGRFVEIGKRDIYANREVGLLAFRKNQAFMALDLDRLCAERPAVVSACIRDVAHKIATGVYAPPPHVTYSIGDIENAMRHLAQARHMGKVVVSLRDADVRLSDSGSLFRSDGTYLISGGLGGFGLATADWLVRNGARTVVLVGRHAPSTDAEESLASLRAAGANVVVKATDVADPSATRCLLEDLRATLPPVRGVFHAAMVLDDAPLDELDRARLDRAMRPKIAGAWNLHMETLADPIDHFVLFSSIASLLGNPLQANYAAANAFFGPLAHYRAVRGLPGLCVDWGVLAGAGYLAKRQDVADHLARQGYLAFQAPQALEVLGQLLRQPVPQVMAARMDWRTWARSSPTAATAPKLLEFAIADVAGWSADAGDHAGVLDSLRGASPTERRDIVATFLREHVARILGTAPARLDAEVGLADMGFDSLMAVELTTLITIELGVELGVVKLLQGLSLDGLVELVIAELHLPETSIEPRITEAAHIDAVPVSTAATITPTFESEPDGVDYSALDYTRWSPRQRVARTLFSAAWRWFTDLRIEGLEHLPVSGPYILAANHVSLVDAPLVMTVLPRRTIVFAGERLRESPVFNWFLSDLANAIYIRRGVGDMEALERGLAVLRAGGVLGVGPEGGIGPTAELRTGHTGVAYLATRSDVPVVPVAAWGQEQLTRHWRRLHRPQVHVRVGRALRFPPGEHDGLTLRRYTDDVMRALAELLPPEYRGAYDALRNGA